MEPVDSDTVSLDRGQLPRWAQVIAGLLLTPVALLCVIGAGTIFTLPKVRISPPLLLLGAAVLLGTLWTLVICVRLVCGIKRNVGLLGPWVIRFIAVGALGLVVSGFFTGYYREHSTIGGILAISYVGVARRLFALANTRSSEARNTSSRTTLDGGDTRGGVGLGPVSNRC